MLESFFWSTWSPGNEHNSDQCDSPKVPNYMPQIALSHSVSVNTCGQLSSVKSGLLSFQVHVMAVLSLTVWGTTSWVGTVLALSSVSRSVTPSTNTDTPAPRDSSGIRHNLPVTSPCRCHVSQVRTGTRQFETFDCHNNT